ncbi:hypothetical protein J2D69_17815 [Lysinibacillus sphaericus]|uniref:Uncharacterized protein n=3 Tax=Lysinibacillus TaxID=400634 RepID=B1HX58_LYSSC|nr:MULTISPECIES: hypothetical protein [Lysinibacillus]MBE5084612.1 hypothetical protein [Bacillus thuringiensis]ACA41634.1 hypothetical protein Bsph_4173 [Lysinibacillus sphaericus C3-41]AMO32503.1 hypothetical protein AR327_08705 [Lysinibacillus sphaericus]AMR92396.1 hypothetical protein A1T07_20505 [Lysinibacillus sphaericus]ANA46445.1 hypothetical protein A2J09_13175 [Lysinibacillus sphaericus]
MIPANIEVNIDKQAIQQYIKMRLDEEVREIFFLVDLKKMSELLCMSERYIEDEFLRDPRVKVLEVRRRKKRWWKYKPLIQVIDEIVSEW